MSIQSSDLRKFHEVVSRSQMFISESRPISSLSVSSPPERRSSGRRPPSCSSPRRTQTDACRPRCSPFGPPYSERRAEGSPACSSGLRGGVREERGGVEEERRGQIGGRGQVKLSGDQFFIAITGIRSVILSK